MIAGVNMLKNITPNNMAQLVDSLCHGSDSDHAFHTLIEADKSNIPLLIQQLRRLYLITFA